MIVQPEPVRSDLYPSRGSEAVSHDGNIPGMNFFNGLSAKICKTQLKMHIIKNF
tara:strand:+ start:181 stop:342 length:162 start_codon:yes stop_codon:yes gene_type:complete